MTKHNASNERIKRKYFVFLKEAKRQSEPTIDAAAKALDRFETYTKYRDFRAFHLDAAVAFKKNLAEQKAHKTEKELSKATLLATLTQLRRFFEWLSERPGYKSRFKYSDAQYFNLSENDRRIAKARREQKFPTLEQVKHTINSMPARTEIERRNQAVIAFTLLTGARDSAIASAKLKHVDLITNSFNQDAREVRTKFRKSFTTFFFPVGDEIRQIVAGWVSYLREIEVWGNDDPLFPATRVVVGATRQFEALGLQRAHWSNASPIRLIFREAFTNVGLPCFNPHSLRNTLVQLGERLCTSPEQFKAWSQNLGHEKPLTTFLSYGEVASQRQGEIIRGLAMARESLGSDADGFAEVFKRLRDSGLEMRIK